MSNAHQASVHKIEDLHPCSEGRQLHTDRLQKIEGMRSEILKGGDEAQKLKRLPDDIVERLIDEGFFRFALPEELGGDNSSSMETIEILESH